MHYKINSSRITFREYWWGSPLQAPIAAVIKLFRIPIPSSTDDPPVESILPFEVAESNLPEEVRARFSPLINELTQLGYRYPIFHFIPDPQHSTKIYWATFAHASGQSVARIHHRIWTYSHPPKLHLFPIIFTRFSDGTTLISTSGKPDLAAPAIHYIHRKRGANVSALYQAHQQKLATAFGSKAIGPISGLEQLQAFSEDYHLELRDFHLKRGVFVPLQESEKAELKSLGQAPPAPGGPPPLPHAEVMAELTKLQQKQSNWTNAIILLIVSALLFMAAGSAQWSWKTALVLIPILLFHEFGHYVAMRFFHYKNLRMFFIPFFGAAVSGQNYNVSGWKKALVSLAGPVPGIILGVILGIAGLIWGKTLLIKGAIMILILNGYNLLPVLPLDGGWVFHSVLFCRHYILDTAFRVIAAVALIGLGLLGGKILIYLGIFMLFGVPMAHKLARIVSDLRKRGVAPTSPDAQTIPPDTAAVIIDEVKKAFPKGSTIKTLAQQTLHIFETLNARPPGVVASAAILVFHFGALLLAVAGTLVFTIGEKGDIGDFVKTAATMPQNELKCGSIQSWSSLPGEQPDPMLRKVIIASFRNFAEAGKSFSEIQARNPEKGSAKWIGSSVLLSLPAEKENERSQWVRRFEAASTNVFVQSTNFGVYVSLSCIAPTDEVTKEIEDEIQFYLGAPIEMNLVPPWSPNDERSEADRNKHKISRSTYFKVNQASFKTDPLGMKDLQKKLQTALKRGDDATVEQLRKELQDKRTESFKKELEKLRQEDSTKVDRELIDLYEQWSKESYTNRTSTLRLMGKRMGQLEFKEGRPDPGEQRFSTRSGFATRTGLLLSFSWLSFPSPIDGVPALVGWLCAKGCVDLRYEFISAGALNDLDLEE